MNIKSISISNFHCYYGANNLFEFQPGLNIVLGPNGYGKSKLYDAFQWIFTNNVTDNDHNNRSGFRSTASLKREIISEKALLECQIGDSVECKVVLEVENVNGNHYQLIRSYTSTRQNEAEWLDHRDSKFSIYQRDVIHFKPIPETDHARILESLLPADVRPYVWFQGERGINNLIDTSNDQSLKNVIKRLSDIDKWDKFISISTKAYESSQNAFDQALRASKRNLDRITELQAKQQSLNKDLASIDVHIEEAQKNLKAAQDKNESLAISLENAQNLAGLRTQEEAISLEIRKIETEIDEFYLGFNKQMFSSYWILTGTEGFIDKYESKYQEYSNAILEKKAAEHVQRNLSQKIQTRLPEGVPEPMYIKHMLESEHCLICNRPAPRDSEAYKAIRELIEKQVDTVNRRLTSQDPLFKQLYHNGLVLRESILNAEHDVKESLMKISELTNRKKVLELQLESKGKDIQEQLRISGISNPKHVIDSFRISAADIKSYGIQVGNLEKDKEQKAKELKQVNADLAKLSEGQIEKHLITKRDLLEDFAELTKRIKGRKFKELITVLEDKANEHYENINEPTGAFYGKIKFIEALDGGYRPCIVDPSKGNADVTGSSNTSLISSMKLAIIMAIVTANKIRNYNQLYPLISDAPVSDFDVIKTRTFLLETAKTFNQSIIIMYKYLEEDSDRVNRYLPDKVKIDELREALDVQNKHLTIYQLDLPPGETKKFRNEIEIKIKKYN